MERLLFERLIFLSRKLYNNRDKNKESNFMASGIYTKIKKRIELAEPGTVF